MHRWKEKKISGAIVVKRYEKMEAEKSTKTARLHETFVRAETKVGDPVT